MTAPACRTPGELPDFRLWLADQWLPGRPLARHAASALTDRIIHGTVPSPWNARNYARWEHDTVRMATLWWIGEEMVDLLIATARTIPDDMTFAEAQAPSPSGLVVFAKPWLGIDAITPGHQIEVDAMMWGSATLDPLLRPGAPPSGLLSCSISSYRRMEFDAGLSASELEITAATGGFAYGQVIEHTVTPADANPGERRHVAAVDTTHGDAGSVVELAVGFGEKVRAFVGRAWVPLGRSDWPISDRIGDIPFADVTDECATSYVEDRKVLAAFWTLMHQQGIASRIVRKADRPATRRHERAGLTREASSVQVVTLRKLERTTSADDGDSESGPAHDHRWLVSGHWRWQPFGPGRAQRRLQFIAPYIKGPDDKPLRTRERVNAFIR